MGSNNFLEWNPNANNQENNTNYVGDSQRANGAPNSGGGTLFPSLTGNKLFRQASLMVAALGQMLANKGYTISDGDATGFTPPSPSAALTNLIGSLSNIETLADFPASLSGTGTFWQKLPSGLIIQGGGQTLYTGNPYVWLGFPIAFPTACMQVYCSMVVTQNTIMQSGCLSTFVNNYAGGPYTTGFYQQLAFTGGYTGTYCNFLAFGY